MFALRIYLGAETEGCKDLSEMQIGILEHTKKTSCRGKELIYFIQQGEKGPVKIGHTSSNLMERVRALQLGNPLELKLIGSIDGTPGIERALHKKFSEFNMRGEWFKPDPNFMSQIKSILHSRSAQVDVPEKIIRKSNDPTTQIEIATRLGITDARLSQILSGANPGNKTAEKMAELTGLPWHAFRDMDRAMMRRILEDAVDRAA